MSKWNAQTTIAGSDTSVSDLLLLSDQSAVAGTRDRNIDLAELSVAVGRFRLGQTAHGLAVGEGVRFNGTSYVEATADTATNAQMLGLVVEVIDADTFVMQQFGRVYGLSGLVAGSTYYLQDAGGLGTSPGTVSVPVLVATSTSAGWILAGMQSGSGGPAYEEGTWTPLVSDGTNNATMQLQDGSYTRVGDTVFVWCDAQVNSIGSVASARMYGLPFAVAGTTATFACGSATSLVSTAGYNLSGTASAGNTSFEISRWDVQGGVTQASGGEISSSATLRFSGFYRV